MSLLIKILAALAVVAVLGLTAVTTTFMLDGQSRGATAPAQVPVTASPPPSPSSPPTVFVPPPPAPDSYVQDIWNAGITAPAGWIDSTGQALCSAWESWDTTTYTDQILTAGGIHPYHLVTYDTITAQDLCPGTPGGP